MEHAYNMLLFLLASELWKCYCPEIVVSHIFRSLLIKWEIVFAGPNHLLIFRHFFSWALKWFLWKLFPTVITDLFIVCKLQHLSKYEANLSVKINLTAATKNWQHNQLCFMVSVLKRFLVQPENANKSFISIFESTREIKKVFLSKLL